ncbi:hypothetical protein BSLG_003761 [Batrachochytrium salamandrivorans]|nr:hypothetical protein BSLG_003761 [Batrachochytrium salamandrivorans]
MILAFAKIWCCRNADIVNDYFRCSKDAEDSRQGEYDAAVMIQKTWRRVFFEATVDGCEQQRSQSSLIDRDMSNMRQILALRESEQRETFAALEIISNEKKLLQIASTRHHLLGTKAIPGVFCRVKTATAVRQPDLIEGHSSMDSSAIIPESRLRQNPGLEQWINEHVSKNPRNIRIRPLSTPEPIGPEGQKLAQGPFLPKYRLIQKIQKPLHPTLRVETGFFDTPTFLREEQRHHLRLCGKISSQFLRFISHKVPCN